MFRGWFEAPDNRWLFFDCGPTETCGMMVENQWSLINGQWYRFYEDGYLCQGKLTPDFYFVEKDGVWIENISRQTIIEMLQNKMKSSHLKS